jgi:hypothetical protein
MMAKKRRTLTTPEYEAELDARTEQIREMLLAMEARAEEYRRAREERRVRRRRWWRLGFLGVGRGSR